MKLFETYLATNTSEMTVLGPEPQMEFLNPEENSKKAKPSKLKVSDSLVKESVQIVNKTALNVLAAMPTFKIENGYIEEPCNPFDVPLLNPKGK
jgi:hypothetical protein